MPHAQFSIMTFMENSTFLIILEKSLPENHALFLFCHFGIHSNIQYIHPFISGDEDLNPIKYYSDTKDTNGDIMSYVANEALNDSVCSLSDSLLNILE